MVSVKKKIVGKQTYYYLEHSYRENDKVLKKEKYLGKALPKNIERLKKDFIFEIYKKKWLEKFEKIRENFSEEQKRMPESAKEKQMEACRLSCIFTKNCLKAQVPILQAK